MQSPCHPAWVEILQVLETELREANAARGQIQERIEVQHPKTSRRWQFRFEREQALRPGIDLACQIFAQRRRWPLLDPEHALCIWDRITEARNFVNTAASQAQLAPQLPPADMLRWLLVDYWHFAGLCRWQQRRWACYPDSPANTPSA